MLIETENKAKDKATLAWIVGQKYTSLQMLYLGIITRRP